jgi:hypothetical protein
VKTCCGASDGRTGVRENGDLRIYEDAIAAYLSSGAGAVWLRMLVGEVMSRETLSFQERYGWTRAKHRQDLTHDFLAAGLSARIPALGPVNV